MDVVSVLALLGQVSTSNLNEGFSVEVYTGVLSDDVAVYNKTVLACDNLGQIVDTAIATASTEKGVLVLTICDDCSDVKETTSYRDRLAALLLNVPEVDPKQLDDVARFC